ncbi:MAG TPA: pilus assembly protein TadG-related protein [Candidatus Binatia bacterium]|nr:pilus assembly protein TadG-related protein [Candidatus Binatia bacterium]
MFTALAMFCLMGFLALATDVGLLLRDKVNLQKVADAAAIAGAAQLPGGNYTAAAQASAAQNGLTNGTNGTVSVTLGTTYHPNAVKVYVSQPERTYFMGMFGYSSVTVGATAVAGITHGNGCLYALDLTPFKSEGITMNGSGNLNLPNCSVYDNSGLLTHGASGGISAKSIAVSGSYSGGDASPAPTTSTLPVPDPMAYWSTPPAYGSCPKDPKLKSGTAIPGCYEGLTVTAPATLSAGLYIIQGSLNLSGVTATGVTFYIDGAHGGSFGGVDGSHLSAPTTGTPGTCTQSAGCNGMLIWDTEVASPDKGQQGISFGPGNATLYGVLYFPNASLKFHGDSTTNLNTIIVASAYVFDGTVNINNYVLSAGQPPVMLTPTMVE